MLEKETERIFKIVVEQTISKGEAVSVRDILAADIPYPVKVFFRADVERMLNEELRRGRLNTRFNYHQREVENLQRQMNSLLVLNFTFLREEYLQKLEDGVHLTLNYLLRPQWTLTNFLFNSSGSITVADMKPMLAYFGAYEYLKDVLFHYVDDGQVETLTLAEFQELIARIDVEYMRRKSGMEVARLATPIYDFVHFSPFSSTRAAHTIPVPVKALVKFFDDKRLRVITGALEQKLTRQNLLEVQMEQLQSALDEVCRSNPEALQPDEGFHRQEPPLKITLEHPPASQKKIIGTQPSPELQQPVLADLRELISRDDRKRFLKKIFKKDDVRYTSSVQALNAITSWKEASMYIDKILISNDVDPYSNEAVRFSEVVYQRFFPKTPRR